MAIRRMEAHRKNRKVFLKTGKKIEGFCSRCAEIACRFNITPKSYLPTEESLGKIAQYNCKQVDLDSQIPNTNKG
jgi:hypothetical protein